jgi:hypothetical protein
MWEVNTTINTAAKCTLTCHDGTLYALCRLQDPEFIWARLLSGVYLPKIYWVSYYDAAAKRLRAVTLETCSALPANRMVTIHCYALF